MIYTAVHVFAYLGIGLKIAVDEFFGLASRNLHALGQTESRDAIDDTEVGGFCLAALVARHFFQRFVEDACSRGRMNVFSGVEVLNHLLVAAEMRHDAQLDLRVVGREENAARLRHKGFSDFATVVATHRNVLQVRIARGEASGGGNGLIERGVDALRRGIDELWECFDVSAEQLFECPM